jgi:tetraacyldisaccharide 4'-kinase
MASIIKYLLFPFTILYGWVTDFRNHLYNIGIKKSFLFEANVFNVGNLTVGGTGKSPMIEYLIQLLLSKNYSIATLSRGYGRKTKGFLFANDESTAESLGDEPLQFYQKFKDQITVTVCEERALAIPTILYEKNPDIILLDDAYQHRTVQPNFNILLTDYQRLFYRDFPFPSGRLRERRKGASRADVVVVTKCPPSLEADEKQTIAENIQKYTRKETDIFFSKIHYGQPKSWDNGALIDFQGMQIVAFSGIAQPHTFEKYVAENSLLQKHFVFPDHYYYQTKDIETICQFYDALDIDQKIILTTEKDWVKIQKPSLKALFTLRPVFYIPIEVEFLEREQDFISLVLSQIYSYSQE